MIYATEARHKYGVNVVESHGTRYEAMLGVLCHIEQVLQRSGLDIEIIDVEPADIEDTSIRFSLKLGDQEI